ncbi:unnamed protein product [Rotaria sordida]|uniref:Granulin n=1 Tax=Rotaria sordida TaxID=392033 RepID=A0A818U6J0_9BILA|nr:unnamed protein product [Rotaria sordida]CAF3693571.1 unnamed protein product [Rotaria sordida]
MLHPITTILFVMLAIGVTTTHGQRCPSNFCGSDTTQGCCSYTQLNSTSVQAQCCPASTSCCVTNHCCPSAYPVCCAENQCCPQGRFCCIIDGVYKCCPISKTGGDYATDSQPAQVSTRNLVKK